jgi:hypothetical protein
MNPILEHVSQENKEWVMGMTPKQIASLLDTLALIPHIKMKKDSDIPAIRGQEGENTFESIVSQFMSTQYKLENVAKSGKAGDFVISWKGRNKIYKILVDVKNYKTTVPSKEVDKLYRDININNVAGGLMISLQSKIVGVKKMMELKEYSTNRGIVPVIFMKSGTPSIIAEVIKLLFYVAEIKDLKNNKVQNHDDLLQHINRLNDNVQIIIDCRETLQLSKTSIEKSLNDIMLKLMTCEYSLVSKINQINSTLVEQHSLVQEVSELKIAELSQDLQNDSKYDDLNIIKTIVSTFKVSEESESMLYRIHTITDGWQTSSMDIPSKIWKLIDGDCYIMIKFSKTPVVIFPIVKNNMLTQFPNIKTIKKPEGFGIKLVSENIEIIIKLCMLLRA